MAAATVGTGLCAASAGTFNQIIEQGHDAKMLRTRLRPLPSGRIGTPEALGWGVSAGLGGTALLYSGER
jgi:protoheme IX farnesyltransferase